MLPTIVGTVSEGLGMLPTGSRGLGNAPDDRRHSFRGLGNVPNDRWHGFRGLGNAPNDRWQHFRVLD